MNFLRSSHEFLMLFFSRCTAPECDATLSKKKLYLLKSFNIYGAAWRRGELKSCMKNLRHTAIKIFPLTARDCLPSACETSANWRQCVSLHHENSVQLCARANNLINSTRILQRLLKSVINACMLSLHTNTLAHHVAITINHNEGGNSRDEHFHAWSATHTRKCGGEH